ncbi:MAG: C10 family peptidase [Prevotellaceae bacterium]|jgi:hypothetical protein|nr:C10 family peptidase [Prevotellaceae bacterium]
MKKIRLFLALTGVALLFFPAKAERVNIEKAEKIARMYARTTPRLSARKDVRLSRTVSKPLQRHRSGLQNAAQQEEPLYYVFTMNGDGGFIIVAGDDVAKPVLGYSDEGTYDESNPNLAYWMGTLAQEIAEAIENGVSQDAPTKAAWNALDSNDRLIPTASGDYVDPLVKTKWNQDAPYNNLCPKVANERTVTGCVATAMAQIMKYHNYPASRTVTIPGYTTGTRKISIPALSGSTYGWNSMANTYASSASGAPADAVATLMYHCGASVKMDYNIPADGGSAAYSFDVAQALKAYFNYDAGVAYRNRDYYPYAAWIALLKTEIRAGRPVYYSGSGDGGGHAFVCDGYDADDLFHFNWGWGGSSDGYFEISALNPGTLGIGGGSGGYNTGQEIITGIQRNQGGSGGQPAIQLGLSTFSAGKPSLNNVTESFNVTAGDLTNTGVSTIASAYLGVLLYNQDGSYRDHKTASRNMGLQAGYHYTTPYSLLTSGYSLPSGLPAGTYTLYPAYSETSGIPSIIPGINGDRYIRVVVGQNGQVTLTGEAVKPNLSLKSLTTVGNLYQNKTGSFEAEIANSGAGDYNSSMRIRLGSQTVTTDPVVIPAGTTRTIGFSGMVTLTPGNYSLSLWYDPDNVPGGTPDAQLGNAVTNIAVKAPPTTSPSLSLVGTPSFQNGSSAVPQNTPNLTVQIKNTGGLFDDVINVFVFPTTGNSSIGSFGQTKISIEKNETKSIQFNNPIDFLEVGVQYRARVYYYDSGWNDIGNVIYFTVASPVYSSDATLKSLVVKDAQAQTPLTLTPAFSSAVTNYTAVAGTATNEISIIGEANHKRAKFTNIENQLLSSGNNTFNLKVTAENGTAEKTYTVTVVRSSPPVLGGAVTISGNAVFGETLWAITSGLISTPSVALGTLSYQWKRNNTIISDATGANYTLAQADIAATITVTVTAANTEGSVTSVATGAVAKAPQAAPATPEQENKTSISITLKPIANAKYASAATNSAPATSSGNWQDSPAFTGLSPNTTYYFFAYYLETATHKASPASAGLAVTTATEALLIDITATGLTPPFNPLLTAYTVTLPCEVNDITVSATPPPGVTVDYMLNNHPVHFPLTVNPGVTTLVIQAVSEDGFSTKDYTIAIARLFDASIIRRYWDDVLAVNLNTSTNGGYTFSGFQWTRNGQPMANETGPYLYFRTPPPASDRYNVLLTTNGQTLPVCRELQVTPAEAQPAGLLAYPNPARHTLTIENPQWKTAKQTDLINLNGTLVRSYPSARIQAIDVSGLPAGLYVLRAGAYTIKIVIE